ncbi:MAG TPA: glycosyltransferase family 4 protein [Candidatus Dormibacteraeota bacterium]|nr:glycosyltransferase family 4 protein [Candidatus Dormibacteraeota bacterium]
MTKTLAMDCSFLGRYGDLPSVFGFDIAVNGFVDALLRYSTYDRFFFFYQPGQDIGSLSRSNLPVGADLQIQSINNLPTVIKTGDITTWFQPDTETMPVNYRNAFTKRPFPFSTVIHNAFAPDIIRRQFLWLLLDGFTSCDSFICTSQSVRHAVQETLDYITDEIKRGIGPTLTFRGRLDVLPIGVDTTFFTPQPKVLLRRELGWPEDAFTILWLGRFSALDKADLLPALRTFRRLLQANPRKRLRFVLAGSDHKYSPFVPALHAFVVSLGIAEHVLILDDISQNTRNRLFAAADVFTSPSDNHQETFGITPIEAMASGTPQVVSDWDGYKDSVLEGVTGYRIPTYWISCDSDEEADYGIGGRGYQGFLLSQSVAVDLPQYQAAIQKLIDDPDLLESMGVASRKRALEVYSWKTVILSYERLWTELNSIAQQLPSLDLPTLSFARGEVCRRFASYPTAMLTGHESISISEDGCRLLSQDDPYPFHSPQEETLLKQDMRLSVLESVRAAPSTFVDIAKRFAAGNNGQQSTVFRAIMWGIKHGLLQCTVV